MQRFIMAAAVFFAAQPGICTDSGIDKVQDGINAISDSILPVIRKTPGKFCVLDFTARENVNITSEFGQLLAEKLAAKLISKRKEGDTYEIIERQQLIKIMYDSTVFGADSDQINELRERAGMDYLVSGTYNIVGKNISVNARVISASSGTALAAGGFNAESGPELEKMISRRIRLREEKPGQAADEKEKLSLEAALVYVGSDAKLRLVSEGMVLTSNDDYALYLRPAQDCYVYVYQVDAKSSVARLFPNPGLKTAGNPLKAGEEYWVPNDSEFFFLDENTGPETVYVIAAREELPSLNRLISGKKAELQAQVKELKLMGLGGRRKLEIRRTRPIKGSPADVITKQLDSSGDFYYKVSFQHE